MAALLDSVSGRTVRTARARSYPDMHSTLFAIRGNAVVSTTRNPRHPFTQDNPCPKINQYQERIHSPDRVLYPMWAEAKEAVSSRLMPTALWVHSTGRGDSAIRDSA